VAHAARRPGRQVSGARLRLIVLAAAGALGAACARTGDPPGGPPDVKPPVIIGVYPESGAVVPDLHGDAVIQYDEVIDEMGGGGTAGTGRSASGLATRVLLSPTRGAYKVSWHRSSIHVKPVEGWKAGRVYHLEVLAGITDLRRNTTKGRRTIVFSTGPPVPQGHLDGTVVQWVEQHILAAGLVRAQLLPDTIAYLAVTDSTGHFRLDALPPGKYLVYAIVDQNNNRQRDRREPYDSAMVALDSTASPLVLWTFAHDSIGPRVRQVDAIDSITARLTFSAPLDPAQPLDSLGLRVLALPDSTPVRVAKLYSSADYDSLAARERAVAESIRAANDTTKKVVRPPKDTTTDTTGRVPRVAPTPPVDTSALHALLRQRPVPQDKFVMRLASPLKADSKYFVEVRGARNLNGARADGHTVLVVPKPKPPPSPADSAKAAADSARRRAAPPKRPPRRP